MVTSRERPKSAAKPKVAPKRRRLTVSQKIIALGNQIPDEDIAKFPRDGAEQLDHYIYGTPKRR